MDSGHADPDGKRKRRRRTRPKRNVRWKPYAKLTWQERRDLEMREAAKAASQESTLPDIPRDEHGNILPGVQVADYQPQAPRNTTQVRCSPRARRPCCALAHLLRT